MKYLLILLFLFSTHSFSGEIDGKGIDCNMLSVDDEKYQEMFWFNNDRWERVHIFDTKQKIVPDTPTFIMKFPFSPELTFDYYYNTYNDNFITFDNAFKDSPEIKFYTHYKLNRKTLELQFHKTKKSTNKKKLEAVGKCRVFTGFDAVKRRQEELIRIDQQRSKKEREGNKI